MELYPYYAGSGYAVMYLPPWAVEGGYEEVLKRLKNSSLRPKIIKGMEENSIQSDGTFAHLPKNKEYIGMDYKDVAKKEPISRRHVM